MSVIDIYEEELREFIENSNREIVISEKRPDADDSSDLIKPVSTV